MDIPSLSSLTNDSLKSAFEELRKKESDVISELVLHLSELDARGDYRDYYTDRLVALVRDGFAEDIERFGYEFSGPTAAVRPAACPRLRSLDAGALTEDGRGHNW
mgnify:CR=1 FL=1